MVVRGKRGSVRPLDSGEPHHAAPRLRWPRRRMVRDTGQPLAAADPLANHRSRAPVLCRHAHADFPRPVRHARLGLRTPETSRHQPADGQETLIAPTAPHGGLPHTNACAREKLHRLQAAAARWRQERLYFPRFRFEIVCLNAKPDGTFHAEHLTGL